MTEETKNDMIVFVYRDFNEDDLRASMTGKFFFASTKYCNCHAAVYHNNRVDDGGSESITHIRGIRSFRYIPFVKDSFEAFRMVQWIKKKHPILVILSGATCRGKSIYLYRLLLPKQTFAVLMATPSVNRNAWYRWYLNTLLKLNLHFFENILVTKSWPFERFRFALRKARYFEIGFQDFGFQTKDYSSLKLIYLGYIDGREIEKTVEGLALFLKKNKSVVVSYDIIGKDNPLVASKMKEAIASHKLQDVVKYHGFQPNEELARLVRKANIGVCFVPQNGIFGYTSTKTIEYLIAGLPVIGTRSEFRQKYINDTNGVLHDDNPIAFANALELINAMRFTYKPEIIRSQHLDLSMDKKIQESFVPLLKSLYSKSIR
ncbi:MAG: glycosyltransferase [Candidatus Cloacimonetes bacterium]|nr:glycosyltransferase [Candidatus Cloacimonadota bacterium]